MLYITLYYYLFYIYTSSSDINICLQASKYMWQTTGKRDSKSTKRTCSRKYPFISSSWTFRCQSWMASNQPRTSASLRKRYSSSSPLPPLFLPSSSPLPPLFLPSSSPLPPLFLPSSSPLPPLFLPSSSPLPPPLPPPPSNCFV